MEWDVSENLVPVLYFSQDRIQSLTLSPSPVPSCEQMQACSAPSTFLQCALPALLGLLGTQH